MRSVAQLAILVLFALPATGTAAHLLDGVEIDPGSDACGNVPTGLRLIGDDRILLQLQPRQRYGLLLQEHGIDLRIEVPSATDRWLNSEPWRYASEPVEVQTDARGQAELRIALERRAPWARIALRGVCLANAASDALRLWQARMQLARDLSRIPSDAGNLARLAALRSAAELLWLSDAGSEERLWGYFQLAALSISAGMYSAAWPWFERAASTAELRGDELFAAQAELGAARTMMRSGERIPARARLEAARRRATSLGMFDAAASAENSLCVIADGLDEYEVAEKCYSRAHRLFAELGDGPAQAITLINRYGALGSLGRYAEARDELDRAEEIAIQLDNKAILGRVNVNRAQLARWRGDFESALAHLDRARALQRESGGYGSHHITQLIAETYAVADEPVRALHFYSQALAEAERRGDRTRTASTRLAIARLWAEMGRLEDARRLVGETAKSLVEVGTADALARTLLAEAEFAERAGDRVTAIASLQRISESIRPADWRLQRRVEGMRLLLGDLDVDPESMQVLVAAADKALRNGDFILHLELAQIRMQLIGQSGDAAEVQAVAEKALAQGLRIAGEVRGPALRNSLLSRLKPFATAKLWQLPEGNLTQQDALQAIAGLERLRVIEQLPIDDGDRNDALDDLERVLGDGVAGIGQSNSSRESAVLQLIGADATERSRVTPQTDSAVLAVAVSSLAPGQSLLMVSERDANLGLLVMQEGRWRWRPGLDGRRLLDALSALDKLLTEGHAAREEIDAQRDHLADALGWHSLWEGAPTSLAIMVEGRYASLPWALLPAPDGSGRSLLETTRLVLLQSLQPRRTSAPTRLFTLGASQAASTRLAGLNEVGGELRQVALLWPNLTRVERPAASRSELVEALRDPGALVHIGAHGRGDRGLVEDAGLWLEGAEGKAEFISALRLRRLQVRAGTVVLSACESSSSLAGRSLGIGGVAGSLADAGASAVVGTRWPVSDRVAAAFAEAFHRALAEAPSNHEQALQQAVLELRKQPFARHPAHWAGWFLLRAGPVDAGRQQAGLREGAKPGPQLTH